MVKAFDFLGMKNKDNGMALTPWILLYFFVALYLFLLLFCQNLHISAKYVVQDALASAALAGEVADLQVFGGYQDLVIADLDFARDVFEDSLKASLNLSEQGYPQEGSVYFDDSVPVQITELTIYNLAQGQIYKTDLLQECGTLQYAAEAGLSADSRCIWQGALVDDSGEYVCSVQMLDGQTKEIKNTSLYAKISFGVCSFDGSVIILEKDILTDIQQNESMEALY